jgi:hypothetical protein
MGRHRLAVILADMPVGIGYRARLTLATRAGLRALRGSPDRRPA